MASERTILTARIHGVTEEGVFLRLWGKVLMFDAAVDVAAAAAMRIHRKARVTIEDRGETTAALVAVEELPAS